MADSPAMGRTRSPRAAPETAARSSKNEDAMPSEFEAAVERVIEVVMFENWLRFYFIEEDGSRLFIKLPDKSMEQIKKRYGPLHDLADRLNNRDLDHQTSMNEVCLFVAADFSARGLADDLPSRVFDSNAFMVEMQLFGSWVQSHEEKLDENFFDFGAWRQMYKEWRQSDTVREYSKKLASENPIFSSGSTETEQ